MPARRSASVTLGLPGGHGLTLEAAPANIRNVVLVAGAAVLSGLVVLTRRRRRGDGVRRRVVRRLDRIAPRVRFDARRFCAGEVINSDCPVCLCEFAAMPDRLQRVLSCRHALCAECLEAWAVHCTKMHLRPERFGVTRNGQVVSWTPGPKCPLCCGRVDCVPEEDVRAAVIAAIEQRGAAISNFIAYQARSGSSEGREEGGGG